MDIHDLIKLVLTSEEKQELDRSLTMFRQGDYSTFYAENSEILL